MQRARILVLGTTLVLAAGCGVDTPNGLDPASEELAEAPSSINITKRPLSVPADYVATPNGWFHRSCVYEIGDDEVVRNGVIEKRDGQGARRTMARCGRPRFDLAGRQVTRGGGSDQDTALEPTPAPAAEIDGWVADVVSNTVPVDFLSATWKVPHVPRDNTAVVYFFPGLQHQPTVTQILQPVLGYNGSDGGRKWVIYSWDCCTNDNTWHSRPVEVQPGDAISGYMQGSNCNAAGVCSDWEIRASSDDDSSTLRPTNIKETMNQVFPGVLEVYNLDKCSEYPSDNRIDFRNVSVHSVAGATLTPAWRDVARNVTPRCAVDASSTATTATISWCVPRTCGGQCGSVSDGCGGTLNCGTCGHTCSANQKCCEPEPGGGCNLCWPKDKICP
jgi:hypothetical protein